MRMIVAGGGTGGHLFPGLAVAEAVAAEGHAQVLFVGSAYGIEATAIPRTPFPFRALAIRGLRGRGWRGALAFAWQLPVALLQSWRIVGSFRPALVLGLGGYGSVPVIVAAWLRRVPTVLMEQNVHPGFANRLLGHLARRVCTAFAESARFFPPGRTVQTGNPVRTLRTDIQPAPSHFTLFAFGGSQGAHAVNEAVVAAARIVSQQLPGLRVVHQTGSADAEWVEQRYREWGVEAQVFPFVHDMANAYGHAHLVVCRAGATTLAELAVLGRPAILIPYPFAADDHQRTNADVFVRRGAAEMILDADLSGERLATVVLALVHDRKRLATMGDAARRLAMTDAALRVAEVCRQVAAEGGENGAAV
jgi:UDP-N-acetylglucosamine--N-acetylmuramyl-(pentapeptide) pyrophosphoryl-undecaprenol N-acetylglucosamine transferase